VIETLLQAVVARGASDLHLKAGVEPALRVDGELQRMASAPLTERDLQTIVEKLLSPRQRAIFEEQNEIDFAFSLDNAARFRANFYRHRGTLALALRHVQTTIPSLAELHLPPLLEDLAFRPRGLILVTGAVGSGKSTTLAAMIDLINRNAPRKIISIEDPVEFVHSDVQGFITQREVGVDTASFHQGLVHILRQDPDVVFIGEIRDADTMSTALTAADTGRLVLSTLHTADATQTVNRILSFYPPHQHEQVRVMLAGTLQAAIAQRLVRRASGSGRVPAVEILIATGTIKECLLDPKRTPQIANAIAEGVAQYGMQTFDQSLMKLYREDLITLDEALRHATNPHEFNLQVAGIEGASDTTWRAVGPTAANLGAVQSPAPPANPLRSLRR
jgi:twitching motility protein PilT